MSRPSLPTGFVFALLLLASPLSAGDYEVASNLLVSHIIPGTEQVKMLPDGDLEQQGQSAPWRGKKAKWFVGPHPVPAPGVCGQICVWLDTDQGGGRWLLERALPPYQPHWRQVFSLYAWLPGPGIANTAPGIPQEQHICFDKPILCERPGAVPLPEEAWAEGSFIFGDFVPKAVQVKPDFKNTYNTKGGDDMGPAASRPPARHRWGNYDDKGAWKSALIVCDNMADTPIVEFSPPVLRHAAAADFTVLLAVEANALGLRAADGAAPLIDQVKEAVAKAPTARAQRALGYAHMLAFARDLSRTDDWSAGLAAWGGSLKLDPDQPLLRHWHKRYSGFVPEPVREWPKPPADLPAASRPVSGPSQGGTYVRANLIRMRDLLPGTEHVSLAPGGDGADKAAWTPSPQRPGLVVGPLEKLTGPRGVPLFTGWGGAIYWDSPNADGRAIAVSAPVRLPPGRYVISAYVVPFGQNTGNSVKFDTNPGAVAIGLSDGPALWWGWPTKFSDTLTEGVFVFAEVVVKGDASRSVRIEVGPWTGKDSPAKLGGRSVGLLMDNVAVTPADQFCPPVLRANAQAEFLAVLPRRIAATQPGQVEAAMDLDSRNDTAVALNSRAGLLMVQFLRDPSQGDLLKQAVEHWRKSQQIDADQPLVARWRSTWEGCKTAIPTTYGAYRVTR
jgi:hypothetical protein